MIQRGNEALARYLRQYQSIEENFLASVEQFGLSFRRDGDAARAGMLRASLRQAGAIFCNNGKSIHTGFLSPACAACAKGVGCMTVTLSLMCNRACYYCFNPNQEGYEHQSKAVIDWRETITRWLASEPSPSHLALSGGEPLLHPEETLEFFRYARDHLPGVHTRLYTAGDLLTEELACALAEGGLREIRFSIKLEDDEQTRAAVLNNIAIARRHIPTVLVEMPVIPGTGDEMRALLRRLDALGVDGINLLEFCFPLCNAEAFSERGFLLKYPPFETLYNYWYAGGLAVDGSEALCLELLCFLLEEGLNIKGHYCSLENKFTGQIYQQNTAQEKPSATLSFSDTDFFLKTGKVFGRDIPRALDVLQQRGGHIYEENEAYGYLQFHPRHIAAMEKAGLNPVLSYNVMEQRPDGCVLRELRVESAGASASL